MPNIQEVLLLNGKAIGAFPSSGGGIRYDEENDVVQLFYDGQWRDWKSGGMAYPVGTVTTFEYTGLIRPFDVPASGNWKLEVWGGQGGTGTAPGGSAGKGGYTTGIAFFEAGDRYYIVVGGRGANYNGGATGGFNGGGKGGSGSSGGGGGATHISKTESLLKDTLADNLLIVGAGGGGCSGGFTYDGRNYGGSGGNGGGLTGSAGGSGSASEWYTKCGGGTQSAGGVTGAATNSNGSPAASSGYGVGGSACASAGGHYCGGGGGGYYGGGSGPNHSQTGACGGGGGSSYYNLDILTDYSTSSGERSADGLAKLTYLGR